MPTALEFAEDYRSRGWAPIPLKSAEKRPPEGFALRWHFNRPTRTAEIGAWWHRWPDSGVGVVLGRASGNLYAVDIDPRNGGAESMRGLHLPPTYVNESGGGGWHYVFKAPAALPSRKGALPGVDLLGQGSFIVMPPSVHPSGASYRAALDIEPESLPGWVLDLLKSSPARDKLRSQSSGPRPQMPKPFDVIPQGARNETLFKVGCGFAEDSRTWPHFLKRISGLNRKACVTPLTETEVLRIALNAWRKAKGALPPGLPTALRHGPTAATATGYTCLKTV